MGRPLGFYGSYIKNFEKDLYTSDELLFLDNKFVVPEADRGVFSSMLHESHPGQFGLKFLAEYIWWPHIYREKYHHDKSCRQCLKAVENLKVLLGSVHVSKLPDLLFANGKIHLDFAGLLDAFWGSVKYVLLCIDRFTKFASAKS